jgi:hypothetical protein
MPRFPVHLSKEALFGSRTKAKTLDWLHSVMIKAVAGPKLDSILPSFSQLGVMGSDVLPAL